MLSSVALVGRPNVGKSTLFNRLTRSRDALVADHPGVTRDRRYGLAQSDSARFLAIDTGGLGPSDESAISELVVRQVEFALVEADAIVFVVDHKEGLTPEDMAIAERIRRSGKPIIVAVNKCEGVLGEVAAAEFHSLGLGEPFGISALSGQGIEALFAEVASRLPPSIEEHHDEELGPRIAVIGRPNVGKSTLINRLLGSDRLVTSDLPGTTRDSVFVPCERDGRKFVLIDTAGIRRRARVSDAIEKYSIVQSLQAISDARVVIFLLDATEGVTDQDLHLIGVVVEQGRALVIGINKWDGLPTRTRNQVLRDVDRQLDFVAFAEVHHVSALHGSGIADLLRSAFVADNSAGMSIPTPRLNEVLERILRTHPPPMVRGRRIKLRYAHQGGRYPPTIVIHGTQADRAPLSYRRYLENAFREALRLRGTPVRIELRSGENPFAGRRNKLTPRQVRHRERVVRHRRGK
jgi:GTP-binding protein